MPDASHEWDKEAIKSLRSRLGLSQRAFGLELYDYPPSSAQVAVSKLERGEISASAAVRRTLQRLSEGV